MFFTLFFPHLFAVDLLACVVVLFGVALRLGSYIFCVETPPRVTSQKQLTDNIWCIFKCKQAWNQIPVPGGARGSSPVGRCWSGLLYWLSASPVTAAAAAEPIETYASHISQSEHHTSTTGRGGERRRGRNKTFWEATVPSAVIHVAFLQLLHRPLQLLVLSRACRRPAGAQSQTQRGPV